MPMKSLLVLGTAIGAALAASQSFSVSNDLLAFPQYEVVFSDSFISPSDADKRLAATAELRAAKDDNPGDVAAAVKQNQIALAGDVQQDPSGTTASSNPSPEQTYERLILSNRPYICTIPIAKAVEDAPKNATTTPEEDALDLRRASDHGVELLQGMQGNCLYYVAGWWTYSFCYNEGVKQYHRLPGVPLYPPVEDREEQSYMLGVFVGATKDTSTDAALDEPQRRHVQTPETSVVKTQLQTRGETNYLVQKLEGGTKCDLTGVNRRIEVQFHCNPTGQERIALIKETASCIYLMVIHTPRLCNDVAFLPPQVDKPNYIVCQQIVADADVPAWKAIKAVQAEKGIFFRGSEKQMLQQKQHQQKASTGHEFVGDIQVGAQTYVGATEETRIEPGKIVGGNNPGAPRKIVLRLAWTDTKRMWIVDEKEIEAAGIKSDMATVQKSIAQMKQQAKNTPWRLDIVDTDEGREIQGIWGKEIAEQAPEMPDHGPVTAARTKPAKQERTGAAGDSEGVLKADDRNQVPDDTLDGSEEEYQ